MGYSHLASRDLNLGLPGHTAKDCSHYTTLTVLPHAFVIPLLRGGAPLSRMNELCSQVSTQPTIVWPTPPAVTARLNGLSFLLYCSWAATLNSIFDVWQSQHSTLSAILTPRTATVNINGKREMGGIKPAWTSDQAIPEGGWGWRQ